MVSARYDAASRTGRILLRPNRSSSWHANLYLLASLAAVSLVIAGAYLYRGLWPVLPFSILETLALGAGLYVCARRTHRQEVITFSPDALCVESGIRGPEQRHAFRRLWARILVSTPAHPWRRTRVAIRSHGRELEIGAFLNAADKRVLVAELRRMVDALADPPHADRSSRDPG